MRTITFVALLSLLPQGAFACKLSVPASLITGRVAGFVLSVQHASTESINLPPGWRASIDNDPSWTTKIIGQAIVGAAFLAGPEMTTIMTFLPEPGLSCDAMQQGGTTSLTITLYANDKLTRSRIDRKRLGFAR